MDTSAPLDDEELTRYARHIVLAEIGGAGQQKLKRARILVIGAGGLGAPVLQYLAAAGVGALTVIDDDTVSLSNLQRQVIHDTASVGQPKTESAKGTIGRINPHVQVETVAQRFSEGNGPELVCGHDVVIDGSDNFATRYAAADICAAGHVPLVTGAVGRFDGSLTVLKPFEAGADGKPLPSYRDIFPAPPPEGTVPACAEAGVLGALTGVIGTLMAMEALKLITGIGEPLIGRLLLYDGLAARFETIRYRARKAAQ